MFLFEGTDAIKILFSMNFVINRNCDVLHFSEPTLYAVVEENTVGVSNELTKLFCH